eukprot:COSAG01_NODE_27699_length_679_cov_0.891379_1_plen_71_part_00
MELERGTVDREAAEDLWSKLLLLLAMVSRRPAPPLPSHVFAVAVTWPRELAGVTAVTASRLLRLHGRYIN